MKIIENVGENGKKIAGQAFLAAENENQLGRRSGRSNVGQLWCVAFVALNPASACVTRAGIDARGVSRRRVNLENMHRGRRAGARRLGVARDGRGIRRA